MSNAFIMAEHKERHKKSIRFFNDREVRAVWDDEQNCWWFSATDIVRAINNEPDYTKPGNYWRWLKRKLKQENVELVSATHGFKFEAPLMENYVWQIKHFDELGDTMKVNVNSN